MLYLQTTSKLSSKANLKLILWPQLVNISRAAFLFAATSKQLPGYYLDMNMQSIFTTFFLLWILIWFYDGSDIKWNNHLVEFSVIWSKENFRRRYKLLTLVISGHSRVTFVPSQLSAVNSFNDWPRLASGSVRFTWLVNRSNKALWLVNSLYVPRKFRRRQNLALAQHWGFSFKLMLMVPYHANIKVLCPFNARNGFSLLLILLGVKHSETSWHRPDLILAWRWSQEHCEDQ